MTNRNKPSIFAQISSGVTEGPAESAPSPNRLEERLDVLKESQQRVAVRLRKVDPAECRMWQYHNRQYAHLTPDNCKDLIDSIIAQGRQELPAIVRPVHDGSVYRYEVISGARRHWAISWLRANNYPDKEFLIEIRDLTDEEAFRVSDLENRNRQDLSDYERALDYLGARQRYYPTQIDMARRLNVDPGWLSRYLALAELPDEIVAAYATPHDLKVRHLTDLTPLLARGPLRTAVLSAARQLATRQAAARDTGQPTVGGAEVVRLLKAAATPPVTKPRGPTAEYHASTGRPMLQVQGRAKSGVTLLIARDSGAAEDELVTAFRQVLREHLNG